MNHMGLRILIVHNDDSQCSVLQDLLVDEGHDVTTASNGEQAAEIFAQTPYPLVITDLCLPGTSGLELIESLLRHSPDTQFIVITSYASLHTAVGALRAGACDYLVKPFDDLNVILSVVNRTVDKIHLIDENQLLVERLRHQNTDLVTMNRILQELAVKDGLTGLYNHRYFHEIMDIELNRSRRHRHEFSLLFIDVDHFKLYNDSHGHLQGDQLLRDLSEQLTSRVRSSDTVARYGGEEFVMILPETNKPGALTLAGNLCRHIAEYDFDGAHSQSPGKVTVSIGVASYPNDGVEPNQLIETADQALYRAKQAGRNRVV